MPSDLHDQARSYRFHNPRESNRLAFHLLEPSLVLAQPSHERTQFGFVQDRGWRMAFLYIVIIFAGRTLTSYVLELARAASALIEFTTSPKEFHAPLGPASGDLQYMIWGDFIVEPAMSLMTASEYPVFLKEILYRLLHSVNYKLWREKAKEHSETREYAKICKDRIIGRNFACFLILFT